MFRILYLIFCAFLMSGQVHARESLPLDTGYTEISLVSGHDTVTPGERFTVALKMKFEGNWYTYWRNAGDSGEPVRLIWDLPEGISAGPIQWPTPKIKTVGPIVSYALGGEVWLPVNITIDAGVDLGRATTLKAHAYFLVCDDICIPEDGALSLPIGIGATKINAMHAGQIVTALDKIPTKGPAQGSAVLEAQKINFDISGLPDGFENSMLFPHENPIIIHSDPVTLQPAKNGVRFSASPSYGWEDGTPESFDATLVANNGEAIIVPISTKTPVNIGTLKPSNPTTKTGSGSKGANSNLGLWGAILGAFIGGLILNLMPCVFPIISLKALSLAKMAHGERTPIRRSAWSYTAGILISFIAFACLILILKVAGASVGWGFQLQSPWLVGLLSLLLFVIGLNLLGMFEFSGRFQNIGSDAINRSSPFSSFLTGVLAVIVATPCTAPFMAGAVGFALAGSTLTTIGVFLALGFGFALPFLLVAYIPGLLARFPKPGPWMETFKQFLAFPMFAAAIWLTWVLTLQSGAEGLLRLLMAGLFLTFGIWCLNKHRALGKILGGFVIFGSIWFLVLSLSYVGTKSLVADSQAELQSAAWSTEAVATARAEGRPVFVDFTAAWCVTCKVNEITVLKTSKTAALFERTDTEFLIADWTRKDDVIAAELAKFGRAGVPLYLVYKPGAETAEVLPQILTYEILRTALE